MDERGRRRRCDLAGLALASRTAVARHLFGMIAGLALGAVANSARAATLVLLESQPGDAVGAGVRTLLTAADGTLTAAINEAGGASVFFDGGLPTSHVASFHFAPPAGQILSNRAYEDAIRFPFQTGNHPGLDVAVDARGCKELSGRFAILELSLGPGGEVERFAADFEQHCQNGAPALFGAIRLNSEVAISDADSAALRAAGLDRLTLTDQLPEEGDAGLLASLRSENARLGADNASLRSEKATLAADNAKLRGDNAVLRGENARVQGLDAVLRADLDRLGSDLYHCQERVEELELSCASSASASAACVGDACSARASLPSDSADPRP